MARQALRSDPILIGGDNRSGTTMFSVVLDSHPDLVVGPELDFVEPKNLGPYIVDSCDLLLTGDPRVQGPGVETADPEWYFGVQFAKQCHRFGVEFADLRDIVAGVVDDLGTDVSAFDDRCVVIDAPGRRCRGGASRSSGRSIGSTTSPGAGRAPGSST
jgi:hypothetical protein